MSARCVHCMEGAPPVTPAHAYCADCVTPSLAQKDPTMIELTAQMEGAFRRFNEASYFRPKASDETIARLDRELDAAIQAKHAFFDPLLSRIHTS